MDKKDFFDQYKDPRWQKKRLKILKRDKFTCQECGDTESELNVHHRYYDKDLMAWEYEDKYLNTLCNDCHSEIHEYIDLIRKVVGFLNKEQLCYTFDIIQKIELSIPPVCHETLLFITEKQKKQYE